MDKRASYLTYVDNLYKRHAGIAQTTGFSIWALCSAFVYITWQIIPLTAKSNNSEFAALSTVIYAHAYFSYLLIYPFIKPTNKLKNSGVFDYRVPVFGSQIKTNILMQLIGIALPVVLGEVFAKKYSEVPRAIGITFWTFVIFEIAYFLRLVATHIYFIKT